MQSEITVDEYDFTASTSGSTAIFSCNKMILKCLTVSVKNNAKDISASLTLTIQRSGYTLTSVTKELTFGSAGDSEVTFDGLNGELDPYYRWNIMLASSNRNVSFYTCSASYTYHPGEVVLYPNVVKSVMSLEVQPEIYWTADGGYPYIGSTAPDIIQPQPYPTPKPVNAWTLDNNNDGYPWIWGFAKTAKQNIYLKTAEGLVPLTAYYKTRTGFLPLMYMGAKNSAM